MYTLLYHIFLTFESSVLIDLTTYFNAIPGFCYGKLQNLPKRELNVIELVHAVYGYIDQTNSDVSFVNDSFILNESL